MPRHNHKSGYKLTAVHATVMRCTRCGALNTVRPKPGKTVREKDMLCTACRDKTHHIPIGGW